MSRASDLIALVFVGLYWAADATLARLVDHRVTTWANTTHLGQGAWDE